MTQPNRLQNIEEVPYPAAPWEMKGQLWMASFKSDRPVQLPSGLKPLSSTPSLIVVLVRYLEGTLQYDEFAIGTLARLGWRIGIYIDYIWVNDKASVWGGRHIWGLPKNMAAFTWQDSTVHIADEQGSIATITVDMSPATSPSIWMPMPGIGQFENKKWTFTVGNLWGKVAKAHISLDDWSTRFGYHPNTQPSFALTINPFQMRVPAAKVLTS